MINRKCILSVCLCLVMLMLAGCVQARELTEEKQDIIAEYSAGIVLQHADNYKKRLEKQENPVTPEVSQPPQVTAVPENTPEPAQAAGSEEEPALAQVSLNDLYQVSGMNAEYVSYKSCSKYTNQIAAHKGEWLYIVNFRVRNSTKKPLKVDLSKRGIKYLLNVDGSEYQAHPSFLENGGMNFLKTTIPSGASKKAVVVFRVPDKAKNPGSATVTVRDEGKCETEIRLK